MANAEREELQNAAIELNDVLGLEPAISTQEDDEALETELQEAAGDIYPDDDISDETMATLRKIGAYNDDDGDAKQDSGEEEGEADEGDEDDDGEEEEEPETNAKPDNSDLPPPDPKYKRGDALLDAMKIGGSREQIVQNIERLYRHHRGGSTDLKAAESQCNVFLPVLRRFNAVWQDDDGNWWINEAVVEDEE